VNPVLEGSRNACQSLPPEFLDKCSDAERRDVELWWAELPQSSRSDVAVLLDRRQDSCAYVNCADEEGERVWHKLPIVDEDLPFDDPQEDVRESQLELFQYLLAHPEFQLGPDVVVRSFHICVDHPEARRVAETGHLTGDFRCPVNAAECPIRQVAMKVKRAFLIGADGSTRRTTWICSAK
jgi:hypothetical protein